MEHDDDAFGEYVADTLMGIAGVQAVTLGGSRAAGTHRPDSDWDFAVYYRGEFDPRELRDIGWPGEISPIGGWGGGVFNGGAWLEVDSRQVDVHYRDLNEVEHQLAQARTGHFHIERLIFHQAGIPSYLLVAELALGRTLRGELPVPAFPEPLRRAAPHHWWDTAQLTLGYARAAHAERGHRLETVAAVGQATCEAAHAVMAERGSWITNEKDLIDSAGLREVEQVLDGLTADADSLTKAIDTALDLLNSLVAAD